MPRELVAIAPREPVLRGYKEKNLTLDEVRISSVFSAVKHGTELGFYRGVNVHFNSHYDSELKIFLLGGYAGFPLPLGNMSVGNIVEVGSELRTLTGVRDV